jgi:hypothetical protein
MLNLPTELTSILKQSDSIKDTSFSPLYFSKLIKNSDLGQPNSDQLSIHNTF